MMELRPRLRFPSCDTNATRSNETHAKRTDHFDPRSMPRGCVRKGGSSSVETWTIRAGIRLRYQGMIGARERLKLLGLTLSDAAATSGLPFPEFPAALHCTATYGGPCTQYYVEENEQCLHLIILLSYYPTILLSYCPYHDITIPCDQAYPLVPLRLPRVPNNINTTTKVYSHTPIVRDVVPVTSGSGRLVRG